MDYGIQFVISELVDFAVENPLNVAIVAAAWFYMTLEGKNSNEKMSEESVIIIPILLGKLPKLTETYWCFGSCSCRIWNCLPDCWQSSKTEIGRRFKSCPGAAAAARRVAFCQVEAKFSSSKSSSRCFRVLAAGRSDERCVHFNQIL